ncbi:MAG: MFS transporter [Bacteroidales bacterium]|nr:MFS transporter [Bacteroidales bacterium]
MNEVKSRAYLSVLALFFVMGFCDVVGIATSYLQKDFSLSESLAGFIPSMVFVWFLVLSVPSSLLMNKIGRKGMVLLSCVVTAVGMVIPFIYYSFATSIVGFALLGIGNTMLQVSLNPLLSNVVSGGKLSSCLTAGQAVKAVSSFCAPLLALFAVQVLGGWKYLFLIYAAATVLSFLLLFATRIPREPSPASAPSAGELFSLLKDPLVLLLFLGIFFVVGVDVGTNTVSAKLLIERCGLPVEEASLGASVYFFCRTAGSFLGAWLLTRVSDTKYLRWNLLLAVLAMASLFFTNTPLLLLVGIGGIGLFCACVFSILFSVALRARPAKANEISGFMITAVFGGAVIPPLMGAATDFAGSQIGSLAVISLCLVYLVYCSFRIQKI